MSDRPDTPSSDNPGSENSSNKEPFDVPAHPIRSTPADDPATDPFALTTKYMASKIDSGEGRSTNSSSTPEKESTAPSGPVVHQTRISHPAGPSTAPIDSDGGGDNEANQPATPSTANSKDDTLGEEELTNSAVSSGFWEAAQKLPTADPLDDITNHVDKKRAAKKPEPKPTQQANAQTVATPAPLQPTEAFTPIQEFDAVTYKGPQSGDPTITAAEPIPKSTKDDEPKENAEPIILEATTAPAKSSSKEKTAKPKDRRLRRKLPRVLFLPLIAAILYGGLWAGYYLDEASGNTVPKGTYIGQVDISGKSLASAKRQVKAFAEELADTELHIEAGEVTSDVTFDRLGLVVDQEVTTEKAMRRRSDSFVLLRPLSWASDSTITRYDVNVHYELDSETLTQVIEDEVAAQFDQRQEPPITYEAGKLVAGSGSEGETIDTDNLESLLRSSVDHGAPYSMVIGTRVDSPTVSDAEARSLLPEAAKATDDSILVSVLDKSVTIHPAELKTLLAVKRDDNDDATWTIDDSALTEHLEPKLGTLGIAQPDDEESLEPGEFKTLRNRFKIVNNRPVLMPLTDAIECCDTQSGDKIKEGLLAKAKPADTASSPEFKSMQAQCKRSGRSKAITADAELVARRASLEPRFVKADPIYEELAKLGIREEISSCTTAHKPGQGRVVNIQKLADHMRGAVIPPGETLSINKYVGQRTRSKGFVAAGAIIGGVLVNDNVGGGISQFITTFFNAAFFSGIELVDYKAHSIYIDRYPKGVEATISWGGPEQIVKNDTEYGILVWTEYTRTSITVTFYSTLHQEVEAAPLRQYRRGSSCSVVEVDRIIDGKKGAEPVIAEYRDREGYYCNGQPTPGRRKQLAAEAAKKPDPQGPVVTQPQGPNEPAPVLPAQPVPQAG